jgi:DNA-binding response OmpR family regulator
MTRHDGTRVMRDRMESVVIGPDPRAAELRSTYPVNSSTRPRQDRSLVRRIQMPATMQDGIAEILADVDGLPIRLRMLVKGAPAQAQSDFASKDVDIYGLMATALEKIVDRLRGRYPRSYRPSNQRISIVGITADGEPSTEPPALRSETVLRVGPLQIDLLDRTAMRGNRKIDLRPREFQLLKYMMQRSDNLLTKEMLFKDVWNYKFVPNTNLIDVYVGRLRRKVDGPNEAPMIRNIRGAGFVLGAPPVSQDSTGENGSGGSGRMASAGAGLTDI